MRVSAIANSIVLRIVIRQQQEDDVEKALPLLKHRIKDGKHC